MMIRTGDGAKEKGQKVEWACIKDGILYVGSTGKERTDDDGNVTGRGEMWIATVDKSGKVEYVDWNDKFGAQRETMKCGFGAGYLIHESGRWSDVHNRWFFMPRKMSRESYDEVKVGWWGGGGGGGRGIRSDGSGEARKKTQ